MHVLVIGSGAIGGYYGGRLAKAGHDVYFIARGATLASLKEKGLRVESIDGNFHLKVKAERDFGSTEPLNLVLVCVKANQTDSILEILKKHICEKTVVISLQNGIDNEKELTKSVPWEQIVGGIAYIGARREEDGTVVHSAAGRITIGELDSKESERVLGLKETFQEAGIPCAITTDLPKSKWEKLMWNVGFNALSALTDSPAGKLASFPPTRKVVAGLMMEAQAVAKAIGIAINPKLVEKQIEGTEKGGEIIPSMLQDVRSGKETEIDQINGKIVREGEKNGIPTPYNETVWAAVSMLDRRP